MEALPAPHAIAKTVGTEPPVEVVPLTLAPWAVYSYPERGPLRLTWRPGPDRDSVEVELDASAVPDATEYTVEVYQHKILDDGSGEGQDFVEGPFSVAEPWVYRPIGGVDGRLMKLAVGMVLQPEGPVPQRVASIVYLFRDEGGSVVAMDAQLIESANDRLRRAGLVSEGLMPTGQVATDLIPAAMEVQP